MAEGRIVEDRPEPRRGGTTSGADRAAVLESLRILVVEDDPAQAYVQQRLLGVTGEEGGSAGAVVRASTLGEALELLRTDVFDVILLDLMLPDSSGLETVDAVRKPAGDAAIVVLTSLHDEEVALDALARGAQDYLFKAELDSRRLRRALRYAIERRRTDAAYVELQRLQATLDSLATQVAVLDREGRIILVNQAWRAFAAANGYTDASAGVGSSYVAVSEAALGDGEGTAREVADAIRAVAAGREGSWAGEYPCHTPTEERWFSVRVAPCRDPHLAVIVTHDDVTAAKQAERRRGSAERALQESLDRYAMVARATNDILWDWDPRTGAVAWNEGLTNTLGYPPGHAQGTLEWWTERLHPDDRERVGVSLDAALAGAESWSAEYRFRRADGSYAVVLDRGLIARGEDGAAVRAIGSMQDVTEHRRLVAAVERSEAHYRRLVTSAPEPIFALDPEGRFTEINPAGTDLLARPADALLGRRYAEVVVPEDLPAVEAAFRRLVFAREPLVEVELRIVRPSGERRLLCLSAAAIHDGAVPVGMHGIARDVTEERARAGRMRLLSAALENLGESVLVIDAGGKIVYANAAHGRMLGYDPADSPEDGFFAFVPDAESREVLQRAMERTRAEGAWSGTVTRRRTDGTLIPVRLRMERVVDGRQTLIFSIGRDITEELEREQRLRRAERLGSLGTLVGGVAHELNNPLASIVGFVQLLLMDDRIPDAREDLETIRREAERMAKVVSDLRLIARDTQEEDAAAGRAVSVNDVVRHVLRTREYSLRTHNVEVREELDPELPPVPGERGRIEQVVLNLVVNAEQALHECEGSRRLAVRTRRSASGVTLQVEDSGPGIPPEHLDRVFDPFFTTKPPGEGTGLGLSLVHRIVTEYGGELHVESRVGTGTSFRIDLPRAPEEAGAAEPEPAVPVSPARRLRVLVVDDEEFVRRVLARSLARLGHAVDEAADGAQALEMLEGDPDRYDVILSDLRMPGVGGDVLLARLRERGQGVDGRLVFLTGDTASESASRILAEANVPVLAKPIDLNALGEMLARMAGR